MTNTYDLFGEMCNHPEIERQALLSALAGKMPRDFYRQQDELMEAFTDREWHNALAGHLPSRKKVKKALEASPFAETLVQVVRQAASAKITTNRSESGFFAYYYGAQFVRDCQQLAKALDEIMEE